MYRTLWLLAVVMAAPACKYGMATSSFAPAQSPNGVAVRVAVEQGQFSGELLEVRDDGLVVLSEHLEPRSAGNGRAGTSERKVRLFPYSGIRIARFSQVAERYAIKDGRAPNPAVRERVRLLSRFPHGLSPDVLRQLLTSCGQTELAGITP